MPLIIKKEIRLLIWKTYWYAMLLHLPYSLDHPTSSIIKERLINQTSTSRRWII